MKTKIDEIRDALCECPAEERYLSRLIVLMVQLCDQVAETQASLRATEEVLYRLEGK